MANVNTNPWKKAELRSYLTQVFTDVRTNVLSASATSPDSDAAECLAEMAVVLKDLAAKVVGDIRLAEEVYYKVRCTPDNGTGAYFIYDDLEFKTLEHAQRECGGANQFHGRDRVYEVIRFSR